MIYVLCNVQTGDLLQISEEPLSASGAPLMVKSFDMPMPDMTRMEWERSGLHFVEKPSNERPISGVQYLRRFSQQERIDIRNAAKVSAELDDYLRLLDATIAQGGIVDLNDPDVISALTMLEMAGLIAPGRAAEILA